LRIEARPEDGVGSAEREFATWQHVSVTNVGYPRRFGGRPETAERARATIRFGDGQSHALMWATPEGPKEERNLVWGSPQALPLLIHHVRDRLWKLYRHPTERGRTYLTNDVFLTQGAPAPSIVLRPGQRHQFEIAVTYDRSGFAARVFGIAVPSLDDPRRQVEWWASSSTSLLKQNEPCADEVPAIPSESEAQPRGPTNDQLRVLGLLFAEGTRLRNDGFNRLPTEKYAEWAGQIHEWEARTFAAIDEFDPGRAALFRTLNERATPLPPYMLLNILSPDHELELRCHHAKVNYLENEILGAKHDAR
jgi:hypothetical protein